MTNTNPYINHPDFEKAIELINSDLKDYIINNSQSKEKSKETKSPWSNLRDLLFKGEKDSMAGWQIQKYVSADDQEAFVNVYNAFANFCKDKKFIFFFLNGYINESQNPAQDFLSFLLDDCLRDIVREKQEKEGSGNINTEAQTECYCMPCSKEEVTNYINSAIKNSDSKDSVLFSEDQWRLLYKKLFSGVTNSLLCGEFQKWGKYGRNLVVSEKYVLCNSYEEYENVAVDITLEFCSCYYELYNKFYSGINTYLKLLSKDVQNPGEVVRDFLLISFRNLVGKKELDNILDQLYNRPKKRKKVLSNNNTGDEDDSATNIEIQEDKKAANPSILAEETFSPECDDIIKKVLIKIVERMSEKNTWQTTDYIIVAGLQMYPHLQNIVDFSLEPNQIDLCGQLKQCVEEFVTKQHQGDISFSDASVFLTKIHALAQDRLEKTRSNRYSNVPDKSGSVKYDETQQSLNDCYIEKWVNPLDWRQLSEIYNSNIGENSNSFITKISRYKLLFLSWIYNNTIEKTLNAMVGRKDRIIPKILEELPRFMRKNKNWQTDDRFIVIGLQIYPHLQDIACLEPKCGELKQCVEDYVTKLHQNDKDFSDAVSYLNKEHDSARNYIIQKSKEIKKKIELIMNGSKEAINECESKLKEYHQQLETLNMLLLICPTNERQIETICKVDSDKTKELFHIYNVFLNDIYVKIKQS